MASSQSLSRILRFNIFGLLAATILTAYRRIKDPVHPHRISTPDADFILYMGIHGVGPNGQVIDPPSLKNVDAMFLESGSFEYLNYNGSQFTFPESRFENMAFYHKLIPKLRQNNIPILFGDLPISRPVGSLLLALESFLSFSTTIGGIALTLGNSKKNKPLPLLGVLLSLWGVSNILKRLLLVNPSAIRSPKSQALRNLALNTELSHPEDILSVFRNALIASKLLHYSKIFKAAYGRKPNIALAMGSGHELISEYLKRGEGFCSQVLSSYPRLVKEFILSGRRFYYPLLAEVSNHSFVPTHSVKFFRVPYLSAEL